MRPELYVTAAALSSALYVALGLVGLAGAPSRSASGWRCPRIAAATTIGQRAPDRACVGRHGQDGHLHGNDPGLSFPFLL
jgi:hypothetical protein